MFKVKFFLPLVALVYQVTGVTDNSNHDYIKVPYTLWVGNPPDLLATLDVWAKKNSSFYEVMQLAADLNPIYKFEATEYENLGHYITKIGGYEQNQNKNIYWFMYNTTYKPEISNPPGPNQLSPVGVDGLTVKKHRYYLFWYSTWQPTN